MVSNTSHTDHHTTVTLSVNIDKTNSIRDYLTHMESLINHEDTHYAHIEGESILMHTIMALARDSGVDVALTNRIIEIFVMHLAE